MKRKVLLVDDDTIQLMQTKENLKEIYDVTAVRSGAAALKYLDKCPVDVILLDYMMPEMDGPAVLSKIRENPERANIPVIFLTGIIEEEKIQNTILELKAEGYVLKPAKQSDIVAKINEILG